MTKETTPPATKSNPSPLFQVEDVPDEDIVNNIGKFYVSLPLANCSQFLAAISNKEFLDTFSTFTSSDCSPPQIKFESERDDVAAFAANQVAKLMQRRNMNVISTNMMPLIFLAKPMSLFKLFIWLSGVWVTSLSPRLFFAKGIVATLL
jgi:hypothetical protein